MTMQKRPVSVGKVFVRNPVFGFMLYPWLFSCIGAIAMSAGFSFGRGGRAYGPQMLPILGAIAAGLTVIIIIGFLVKLAEVKGIVAGGEVVEGAVILDKAMSGINKVKYRFQAGGRDHEKGHFVLPWCKPGISVGDTVGIVVDSANPRKSIMQDMFCE
ncbi:MAG: hypothetical protein QGG42_17260 [Phycisphaerae bacterium]|jgi:hypothetical protein|nr:hypothetical protein [Phycisphaerae bacterium]